MKNSISHVIAVTLAGAIVAGPVFAQDIIVEPKRTTIDSFVEEVSHDLDDELRRARFDPISLYGGVAQVRFNVDEDGNPTDVRLYKRARDRQVNRVAMRAINRLEGINLASIGYPEDTVIQANVVISTSRDQAAQLLKKLERDEQARLAAAQPNDRVVLALMVQN
ncbi:hypothetical protein [Altererythrobacter sp.]|uniref:energy transducer TonB family protein n=1 Tax=Altererythrobacter sp. TaxID=1872480 RepID=UPI001B0676AD|nr:hypothetical protein [Altererythrobacter sp.]MBO6608950.1 hypothetical protein [Altererythrobacter sp.]MBO6642489.1 hypothetical protein [Altererythrobacter sp.]MBO6709003.1 hypothetical protein [Altererythrobacter sp.]MBO6944889.1 hypothetical protein [Altererythrobacter sp.]